MSESPKSSHNSGDNAQDTPKSVSQGTGENDHGLSQNSSDDHPNDNVPTQEAGGRDQHASGDDQEDGTNAIEQTHVGGEDADASAQDNTHVDVDEQAQSTKPREKRAPPPRVVRQAKQPAPIAASAAAAAPAVSLAPATIPEEGGDEGDNDTTVASSQPLSESEIEAIRSRPDSELTIEELVIKYPRPESFENDENDENPEERASAFSILSFRFISPLISLGRRRPLMMSDLWTLNKQQNAIYSAPSLEKRLNTINDHANQYNRSMDEKNQQLIAQGQSPIEFERRTVNVVNACIQHSNITIIWLFFLQLVSRSLTIIQPFILEEFLAWLANGSDENKAIIGTYPDYYGYLMALLIGLTFIVYNLLENIFYHNGFRNYSEIRAALNAIVYTKSMRTANFNDMASDMPGAPRKKKKPDGSQTATPPSSTADQQQPQQQQQDGEAQDTATGESPNPDTQQQQQQQAPATAPAAAAGGKPAIPGGAPNTLSTGGVVNIMGVDTDKVAMMFFFGVNTIFVPIQIGVLIYFLYDVLGVSIFAGLGVILLVLPLALVTMLFMAGFMRRKMGYSDERVKVTNEILQGIRVVKFYAWERYFYNNVREIRKAETQVLFGSNIVMGLMTFFFSITQPLVTVVTFVVYSALGNDFEPVTVFKAVAFINGLQQPIIQLPNSLTTILMGLVSAKRIDKFLSLPELETMETLDNNILVHDDNELLGFDEDKYNKDMVVLNEKGCDISIENGAFSWTFPKKSDSDAVRQPKVLTDVNFDCIRGKITAIVGPVGSGKSSILGGILGELALVDGNCMVDVKKSVAYVAQSAWIQTCSIKDNILFCDTIDSPEKEARYQRTLDVCALRPDLQIFENGDQTEVGDKGVNLSGGQKQRLNLARAVYKNSDIYIMDDVLSALDAHVSEFIFTNCIEGELQGKTRILVTNQLHYLSRCDYIYILGHCDDPDATPFEIINSSDTGVPTATTPITDGNAPPASSSSPQSVEIELSPLSGDRNGSQQPSTSGSSVVRQVGTVIEHGTFESLNNPGTQLSTMLTQYFTSLSNKEKLEAEAAAAAAGGATPASPALLTNQTSDGVDSAPFRLDNADPHHTDDVAIDTTINENDDDDNGDDNAIEMSISRSIQSMAVVDATVASTSVIGAPEEDKREAFKNRAVIGGTVQKGKQISDEEMFTGDVSASLYAYHFSTMNGPVYAFLVFIVAVLCQGCIIGLSLMLSYWSEDRFNEPPSFYINIYSALLGGAAFFLLLRGFMYSYGCIVSSRFYHDSLMMKVLRATSIFYDTTPVGRIISRLSKDLDSVDTQIPHMLVHLISIALSALGNVITIAIIQPWFIIAMVVLFFLFYALQNYYARTAIQLKRLESNTRSPVLQHFAETIRGLPTIRAFRKTLHFQRRLFYLSNDNTSANLLSALTVRWASLRTGWLQTLLLLSAGLLVAGNRSTMSVGMSGVIMTFALSIGNFIGFLFMMIIDVSSRMNSVERLRYYTETIPEEPDLDNHVDGYTPPPSWPSSGEIVYKNVKMRYRPELPLVLHGLNFHIKSGEKVGVVGRTGSGKSTLMSLLLRLYEIESGEILLDGEDISKIALHPLRKALSVISQDPVLFSGTIRSNLDPFNQYSDDEIYDALDLVQFKNTILSLDGGLNSRVNEFGENFSQGERQILCFVRCILRKPKILLLDEATANIDSATDAMIQGVIQDKFKDCTIITIAHRLNTIITADKILVLDKGFVSECASPEELINAPLDRTIVKQHPYENNPTITNGTFARMYQEYLKSADDNGAADS